MASIEAHDVAYLKETLIVLTAAGVVIPVFARLRMSPVLGFIAVGMLVGPFVLGALAREHPWLAAIAIADRAAIAPIAEFGIVLLMFMIGLELSFERLRLMGRLVFGLGAAHMAISAALVAAVAMSFGRALETGVVLGLALAMSSTAVVVQTLSEQKRLNTPAGRVSFGVLLFQDIAVVPILFVVGVLGGRGEPAGAWGELALGLAQGAAAVAAIVVLGRLVLRPALRLVAGARSPDSFIAACLLVIIGAGLASTLAGLSAALGGLVAGILMAETEYRRQVEVAIEPFKGLLLGVFLISVGMSIDLALLARAPLAVLAACAALVVGKTAVALILAAPFRVNRAVALRAGALLGPGGEFGFVILGAALTSGLVAQADADLALLAAALTMAAIPLIAQLGDWGSDRLARRAPQALSQMPDLPPDAPPPGVVLAGYGRVGQLIAQLLDAHGVAYLAIDSSPDLVAEARAAGKPVAFGDAANHLLLHGCRLDQTRALIVTLDGGPVEDIVRAARAERAELRIVARARDARQAAALLRAGANVAVPETLEASLLLAEEALGELGLPMPMIAQSLDAAREGLLAQVRAMAQEAPVPPARRRRSLMALLERRR